MTLEEVSEPRPGQRFAFVMDTRLCDDVYELRRGADLLVIESTFLAEDAELAARYGHLTAGQAARVAAESGVRRLVLTHFSQRYDDPARFLDEAREHFDGDIVIAEDPAAGPPCRHQKPGRKLRRNHARPTGRPGPNAERGPAPTLSRDVAGRGYVAW